MKQRKGLEWKEADMLPYIHTFMQLQDKNYLGED